MTATMNTAIESQLRTCDPPFESFADAVSTRLFVSWCSQVHVAENVQFFHAVAAFRTCVRAESAENNAFVTSRERARWIVRRFVRTDAPMQINVDHATRVTLESQCAALDVLANGATDSIFTMFDAAQEHVFELMRIDLWIRFLQSALYTSTSRTSSSTGVNSNAVAPHADSVGGSNAALPEKRSLFRKLFGGRHQADQMRAYQKNRRDSMIVLDAHLKRKIVTPRVPPPPPKPTSPPKTNTVAPAPLSSPPPSVAKSPTSPPLPLLLSSSSPHVSPPPVRELQFSPQQAMSSSFNSKRHAVKLERGFDLLQAQDLADQIVEVDTSSLTAAMRAPLRRRERERNGLIARSSSPQPPPLAARSSSPQPAAPSQTTTPPPKRSSPSPAPIAFELDSDDEEEDDDEDGASLVMHRQRNSLVARSSSPRPTNRAPVPPLKRTSPAPRANIDTSDSLPPPPVPMATAKSQPLAALRAKLVTASETLSQADAALEHNPTDEALIRSARTARIELDVLQRSEKLLSRAAAAPSAPAPPLARGSGVRTHRRRVLDDVAGARGSRDDLSVHHRTVDHSADQR